MRQIGFALNDRTGFSPVSFALLVSLVLSSALTSKNAYAQITVPGEGVITTLAGTGTIGYSGDPGLATSAELSNPWNIAVDVAGNIYFSDQGNNVIRKVTAATGIITTVAGNGSSGYSGDGDLAVNAELNDPGGLAVDSVGNIYFADTGNQVIRKVTGSTGVITTFAGSGNWGYYGDGGPATNAQLNDPFSVSLGPNGNLYIADTYNSVIRMVAMSTGIITTVAGSGPWDYSGDGGLALDATLNLPSDVQEDSAGNLYIADTGNQAIRKVNASTGIITTIAGNGSGGSAGDDGPAVNATFWFPDCLALDSLGNIYITDSNNIVRKITASTGIISTVAGVNGPGIPVSSNLATNTTLNFPAGVAVAPRGGSYYATDDIYFADAGNNIIRAVGGYRTAAPTFSPVSATYSTAQTVSISESVAGSTIYYTTDGTTPTSSSKIYTGPITVSSSQTLNAIAVTSGGFLTAIGTAPYTITQVARAVDFSSGFTSDDLSLVDAPIVSGALQLSDGALDEVRAAWFTTPVSAQAFTSDFNYQALTAQADGITLTLQNDPNGVDAIGGDGEDLGYSGIQASVGIKLDMWNNLGEGTDSTGIYTNGTEPIIPALDMTPSGMILRSGDLMHVHVTYDGATLTWTVSDTVTHASFTSSTAIDIPAIVGGNTAYVGITGSTGGWTSTQYVTAWTHISGPATTFAAIPTFSPVPGTYPTSQMVAISDSTPAATIHYTTDGTTPTISSAAYAGPITVSATETLNAIAVASGYYNSADAVAAYIISLSAAVSVSVSPSSATLYSSQTQQFTGTVSNSANTAVNWTISPTGTGTISTTGLYTAPSSITSQQTVTVTATSQADTSKSASATITLTPPCASNGYGYVRSIVIDHTKVPNTDQSNFPFLFNSTDPSFATIANGGHVTNSSGYDIIFSTDPTGLTKLDHDLEEYNPTTGQVIAWMRLPSLSHTTDTVIYVFYGNSSITTSQQNTTEVWANNYIGVWHLSNGTTLSANDSTANANNGTIFGATATTGEIDGSASFNGSNSYIDIGNLGNLPTNGTISFWMKTSGISSYPNAITTSYNSENSGNNAIRFEEDSNGDFSVVIGNGSFNDYSYMQGSMQINTWYHVELMWNTATSNAIGYLNGSQIFNSKSSNLWPATIADLAFGVGYNTDRIWNGLIDEVRVSNVARSADWAATEFNNQSSPATFYALNAESVETVSPGGVSLQASQSQQFTATSLGSCTSAVTWSLSSGAPGTLTTNGLYTAPASITVQQTVTVTATNQADNTKSGTATVKLIPPPPTLTISAAAPSPYLTGSSQGFVANLRGPGGTPLQGATVTFSIVGANGGTGTSTTDNSGLASYSYTGSASGIDNVEAITNIDGVVVASNTISVSWNAPPPSTSEGSVVLTHPSIGITGLCGAFTDGSGTVIEPIAIGASAAVFAVPAGATQLQLGVDDNRFADNSGTGFVVEVNGVLVTVPPTAMPWTFVAGGLNASYPYGLDDGTSPLVALTGLTEGQAISIAYQSGTVSAGTGWPTSDANGDQGYITGLNSNLPGIYFPTLFMTSLTYSLGQSVALQAVVTNGSGTPLPNVPVLLEVKGANTRDLQAITDSTGTAAFDYSGLVAGTDIVQAQAFPSGEATLASNQSAITWINSTSPPPSGSLTLTPNTLSALPAGGQQSFTVLARDASGAAASNVSVSFVVAGVDNFEVTSVTDSSGHATLDRKSVV